MLRRLVSTILIATIIAGSLDILAAFVNGWLTSGVKPGQILCYIAAGWFGLKDAFAGGNSMIAWGLFFHFLIAAFFVTFFVISYYASARVRRYWLFCGALMGLFAWVVTSQLLIPYVSKLKPMPLTWPGTAISILILVFLFGIPTAWITHHRLRKYVGRNQ